MADRVWDGNGNGGPSQGDRHGLPPSVFDTKRNGEGICAATLQHLKLNRRKAEEYEWGLQRFNREYKIARLKVH
jgi:hypothetical protein